MPDSSIPATPTCAESLLTSSTAPGGVFAISSTSPPRRIEIGSDGREHTLDVAAPVDGPSTAGISASEVPASYAYVPHRHGAGPDLVS
jgi:hypothetical protein